MNSEHVPYLSYDLKSDISQNRTEDQFNLNYIPYDYGKLVKIKI